MSFKALFRRRRVPDSWYEPRRHGLTMGFVVVAGVFGAIWAGATEWQRINETEDFARGFASYELAVALGAVVWAAVGGAIGWSVGYAWERWHRHRRSHAPAQQEDTQPSAAAMPAIAEQPTLTTARLILRPFRLTDAQRVQDLAGTREVADTTLTIPHPYPDGTAARWIAMHEPHWRQGTSVVYAITEGAGGALVGAVGLDIDRQHSTGEMGYWIAPSCWNRGYATEAAAALLAFAFSVLDVNRVQARHFTRNPSSGRVMQKLGMRLEGVHRQAVRKWDRFEDAAVYSILRAEWAQGATDAPARAVATPLPASNFHS